jgi:predicted solute-binding protein
VNELTRDYGDEGRQAIRELYARADVPVDVQFVE